MHCDDELHWRFDESNSSFYRYCNCSSPHSDQSTSLFCYWCVMMWWCDDDRRSIDASWIWICRLRWVELSEWMNDRRVKSEEWGDWCESCDDDDDDDDQWWWRQRIIISLIMMMMMISSNATNPCDEISIVMVTIDDDSSFRFESIKITVVILIDRQGINTSNQTNHIYILIVQFVRICIESYELTTTLHNYIILTWWKRIASNRWDQTWTAERLATLCIWTDEFESWWLSIWYW